MDTPLIPGFITRKQAAERCKRAERTLQRYWSRAVGQQDKDVLQHLKLRTEDGTETEGPDVTKALIEKLKQSGGNPTWYVRTAWVVKTYGPRTEESEKTQAPKNESVDDQTDPDPAKTGSEVVAVLKDRIQDKDQEIEWLRERLKEKSELEQERNKLEADRNKREQQTNELMRELGLIVGALKEQTLLPTVSSEGNVKPKSHRQPVHDQIVKDADIVKEPEPRKQRTKKSTQQRKSSPSKKKTSDTASKKNTPKKRRAQPKQPKPQKPKWYAMPTVKRFLSRP